MCEHIERMLFPKYTHTKHCESVHLQYMFAENYFPFCLGFGRADPLANTMYRMVNENWSMSQQNQ